MKLLAGDLNLMLSPTFEIDGPEANEPAVIANMDVCRVGVIVCGAVRFA